MVTGVRNGLISLEDACNRYKLSAEEFLSWQRLIDQHGMRGLRTTRLQQYRRDTDDAVSGASETLTSKPTISYQDQ